MVAFIVRRLLFIIPTLIVISIVSFIIIQLPPGDYLTMYISSLQQEGAQANRVGAALNLLLCLWVFFSVFMNGVDDVALALQWYKAFSFCWNAFSGFTLHFCLRTSGVPTARSPIGKIFEIIALYGPAIIFTAATQYLNDRRRRNTGWFSFSYFPG